MNFQLNAYQETHFQQTQQNICNPPRSFSTWLFGENSITSQESSTSETDENQDGIVHYINNYTKYIFLVI